MRAIWKFTVPVDDRDHVHELPAGAEVVHVEVRSDPRLVDFWAVVEPHAASVEERSFTVAGTGQTFSGDGYEYVGTTKHESGLVWHLLEVKR